MPADAVIDVPEARVHRVGDLLGIIATAVSIVVVFLLAEYARGTTTGLTADVHGFSALLQRVLVAPVNLFSGIVTLIVPAAVLIELGLRREPRRILEAMAASVASFALTLATTLGILAWASENIMRSMSVGVGVGGEMELQLPAYIAGVAALLTVAGRRSARRVLRASWAVLWIALAVAIISGRVSLTAALLTVLLGRLAGLGFRYLLGSTTDRAYGAHLIDGIRRAGFEPAKVIRAHPSLVQAHPEVELADKALASSTSQRVYAVTTVEGHKLIAVALDADQHAAGFLTKLWSSVRLRGIPARADVSLRHSAEATALLSHAARSAGVRTARVLGMAESRDTMILIYQQPTSAQPLAQVEAALVDDAVLDEIWHQVGVAHGAGVSHRALSAETILIAQDDYAGVSTAWLTGWDLGEVASTDIAKRIDSSQLVAATAAVVGPERAVAAAFRAVGETGVEQFAPMLQSLVLPRSTRTALRQAKVSLSALREAIVELLPDADIEPEKIARFGLRTVVTVIATVVLAYLVFASFNTEQIISSVSQANGWWLLVAAAWVLLTFVGAAVALMAFSPIRLPWTRALLAQVAAAYLALAAPAGVGPAALNLRLLTRRKVPVPLALATVALVQVSGVVVTVVGLLGLTLITGSEGTLAALPSDTVLIAVGAAALALALALTVPKVRTWLWGRLRPMVRQTWPRLAQVLGQPWRLALGLGGNLLLTVAYVGAFDSVLRAFNQSLPLTDVTVLFLLGNAVGAAVPTPGGLGAVEGALTAGLVSIGAANAVAVVLVYRLLTYWARIPLGWLAMKWLQNRGEL